VEHGQDERVVLFPFQMKYEMMLDARYAQLRSMLQKGAGPCSLVSYCLEMRIQNRRVTRCLPGSPLRDGVKRDGLEVRFRASANSYLGMLPGLFANGLGKDL
jgi:hypothetical protein